MRTAYLGILRSELFHLFLDAKARGLIFDAGSIAARLLQMLEAIGRLNGQLRQAGIVINSNQINRGPVKTETILVSGVLANLWFDVNVRPPQNLGGFEPDFSRQRTHGVLSERPPGQGVDSS